MNVPPEVAKTIEAVAEHLQREGYDAETLARRTISPALPDHSGAVRQTGERFVLGSTIGEGGMGLVHLAEQRMLRREVAIKTVKPEHVAPLTVRKLLQEGWITGRLEHPNIVPVHDLEIDDEGRPLLVLKKVEGAAWAELLADPALVKQRLVSERVRSRPTDEDVLEWHVGVLSQVCRALSYAHSRGIVHRDLKPDNVMIGAFGEVYVLDWGIAVSLVDADEGHLPLATEATAVAGTPAYMAPEQLGGEIPRIGVATDVYLVGAVLYELVAGSPPNSGGSLHAILASIFAPRTLPSDAPEELAQIIERAMDVDPAGRFESVDQVRLALEAFLRHASARRLIARADALAREVATREGGLEQSFTEARFAYRAALEAWPESDDAQRGLEALIVGRVELLLARGELSEATSLAASLDPGVAPELRRRLSEARARAEAEGARLAALARDTDRSFGRRTRRFFVAVLGTLWVASPIVAELGPQAEFGNARSTLRFMAISLGVVDALVFWGRKEMLRTRMNRSIVGMIFALLVTQVFFTLGAGVLLEMPISRFRVVLLGLHGAMVAAGCVVLGRWLLPTAAVYTAGFLLAASRPALVLWSMSACTLALLLNAIVANRRVASGGDT